MCVSTSYPVMMRVKWLKRGLNSVNNEQHIKLLIRSYSVTKYVEGCWLLFPSNDFKKSTTDQHTFYQMIYVQVNWQLQNSFHVSWTLTMLTTVV